MAVDQLIRGLIDKGGNSTAFQRYFGKVAVLAACACEEPFEGSHPDLVRCQNVHQRHGHAHGRTVLKSVHAHESRLRLNDNVVCKAFGRVVESDESHPYEVGVPRCQILRLEVEFAQIRPLEIFDEDVVRSQGLFEPRLSGSGRQILPDNLFFSIGALVIGRGCVLGVFVLGFPAAGDIAVRRAFDFGDVCAAFSQCRPCQRASEDARQFQYAHGFQWPHGAKLRAGLQHGLVGVDGPLPRGFVVDNGIGVGGSAVLGNPLAHVLQFFVEFF